MIWIKTTQGRRKKHQSNSYIASFPQYILLYFQLVFEAVNGYGFQGDMALDDVTLQSCAGKESSQNI